MLVEVLRVTSCIYLERRGLHFVVRARFHVTKNDSRIQHGRERHRQGRPSRGNDQRFAPEAGIVYSRSFSYTFSLVFPVVYTPQLTCTVSS